MDQKTLLKEIGLTEKEAAIYQILLKLGVSPAKNVVLEAQMPRGTVYEILDQLADKGLVEKFDHKKKTHFRVKHPFTLKTYLENEVSKIKQAENKLESVLPDFLSLYNLTQNRLGVKFYEGKEGIKKLHSAILTEQKEILAYVYINKEVDKILDNFWQWYFKTRIKNNIYVRAITPNNEDGKKYQQKDEKELRETRLVPEAEFPFTIEKNICGDKVAYFSLKPEELIGVLVESKEIAKTEKSIFELAWRQSTKYS